MARELADVLHYFLPEPGEAAPGARTPSGSDASARAVGVPIGERDAVRVAFAWNLAIEIARAGCPASILVPDDSGLEALRECLPTPTAVGAGLGPELTFSRATDLGALGRDLATLAGEAPAIERRLALVLLPSRWIRADPDGAALLADPLLFVSPQGADLTAAQAQLERIFEAAPQARPGVTIHGVASLAEAERTFERLALRCENSLGRPLVSYGVLVDDLQVYRATVERRAITTARPHSIAARALADVARLVVEDHRAERPAVTR